MKKLFFILLLLGAFAASAAELVTVTEHDGAYTIAVTTTVGIGKTARDPRITTPFVLTALRDGRTVHRAAVALTPGKTPGAPRTGRLYLPTGLSWDTLALYRSLPELKDTALTAFTAAALTPLARLGHTAVRLAPLAEPLYPFEKVQDTGDDEDRLVLVIMGDGYTAAEMEKFKSDSEKALEGLFGVPPWINRRGAFNIYRVDVVSNESGADHLELDPPTYADTALGANYGCWGTARAICIDDGTARDIAAGIAPYDIVIVIVNDATYGGSGGLTVVASTHALSKEIVLHEFGHTFGNLADEYEDAYPGFPEGDSEPNVSYAYDFDRTLIKWNVWIEETTPLPTPDDGTYGDVVGMFEGARYKETGIYRPMESCEMRMLGNPFCPVCIEAQSLQVYNLTNLLDAVTPAADSILTYEPGLTVTVDTLPCEAISVEFALNDKPLTGADCIVGSCTLNVPAQGMKTGTNTLKATVGDNTGEVRNDPAEMSHVVVQWKVLYDGEVITDEDIPLGDDEMVGADDELAEMDIPDETDIPDVDTAKKDDGCSCSVVEF